MSEKLQKLTILVVDDNRPLVEMTKSLLTRFGVGTVLTAFDGQAGFEAFCEHRPDIVISDWMMQPMSGIEMAHLIRHDRASPEPTVPIILMTSLDEKQRVMQARDEGVSEFLQKPFTAHELYKRLLQVLERPRPFVEAGGFYGPDRRRTRDGLFSGIDRRGVEKKTVSFRFPTAKEPEKNEPFPQVKSLETTRRFDFQLED